MTDPGFSLEEIHEMLDSLEQSLNRLKAANLYSKSMPMSYISEAASVFMEFESAGVLHSFGVSRSIANKLRNFDAKVSAPLMLASIERARSFLRRLESEYGGDGGSDQQELPEDARTHEIADAHPPQPLQVWADQWIYVKRGSPAKEIIGVVSELLDEVVLIAKTTNLPEDQAALTDIERAQLIVILETTLAVLKAPMVEPGLLKKTAGIAREVALKTAKTKAEFALGAGLEHVASKLAELLQHLFNRAAVTDARYDLACLSSLLY